MKKSKKKAKEGNPDMRRCVVLILDEHCSEQDQLETAHYMLRMVQTGYEPEIKRIISIEQRTTEFSELTL